MNVPLMESGKPEPTVKQETPSKPYRRGLTPRNLTPEERSRDIQVGCQKRNNIERKRCHSQKVSCQIDMEVIRYADDEVETYADVVDRKLRDIDLRSGNKRFVDLGALSNSVNQLACSQCARETIGEVEDNVLKQFKYFVRDHRDTTILLHQIDKFERHYRKGKNRRISVAGEKFQVYLTDDVMGIASDVSIQCNNCATHCYPMTFPKKSSSRGQKKNTDAEENVMAMLLPFITGVGPTELETILNMQGLPNCQHYQKTLLRWQPTIAEKIIGVSEREMNHAMVEEIKATIVADKGEEYYESWINKPTSERERIGLVVSYDMAWQKRASGNSYSSKSGHAFVVGMQTRRIIDCVVFSTNCKKCEFKPKKKRRARGGLDNGGVLTEDEEEDIREEDTTLWRPSLPVHDASLADEGFDAEIDSSNISAAAVNTPQRSNNTPVVTVTPNTDTQKRKASSPDDFCQPVGTPVDKVAKVLFKPTYNRAVHELEKGQIVVPEQMATNVLEPSTNHPACPCNYDGSPGSMESDGMLWLMKRLHTMAAGSVFYEYIVSDDDTTMKKYLTHPAKRPTGVVNIGGRLPKEIPVPKWFADPTHRAKCVAGKFFQYNKTEKNMSKLDCLRLKKYYSYYIKSNRTKSVEEILQNIMAPIDHLFDDHKYCDSTWCHKKAQEENKMNLEDMKSNCNRMGYYRCKVEDKELYEKLCELYKPYITKERIKQCRHEFETQVNEGMNTCVAKYAPKGRHYSKSISLEARVKVAAGIYNAGYHFFGHRF